MSIELTTAHVGKLNTIYNGIIEQSVDCDVTLPDYCPDIMRILKCNIISNITNTKLNGDRAVADGTAKIKVIYADENNRIFCYEHEYPFSKFTELSASCDSASFCVFIKNAYANCRAVSKRRIDIHGMISLEFSVTDVQNNTIISDATGDGVQIRKKDIEFSSVTSVSSKVFQISEVESLGSSNPSIGKILFANASPVLNETKIIRGKALLKGEICITVIYCADGENNETACLNYSIPFNEIAEIDSLADESEITAKLCALQINAEPKADNDGSYRFLALSTDIQAQVTAYDRKNTHIISDTYSTQTVLDTKYLPLEFNTVKQFVKDTVLCRQCLEIACANPKKLYAVTLGNPTSNADFENGRLVIKGSIPVEIIAVDEDGTPSFCQRDAGFEYSCSSDCENPQCSYSLCVTGYNCTLTGDGKAELKCELNLNATVSSSDNQRVLTELTASPDGNTVNKNPSLTIYFCDGNESVWDIARKYNTTVDEIMGENGLTADFLQEKTMLMIPIK